MGERIYGGIGGRQRLAGRASGLDTKVSTGSTYLALAGTNSTFTLGNGNGFSTVVLGKIIGYGSGLGLRNADSVLRIRSTPRSSPAWRP